jgi:hypothetical protein
VRNAWLHRIPGELWKTWAGEFEVGGSPLQGLSCQSVALENVQTKNKLKQGSHLLGTLSSCCHKYTAPFALRLSR